MSIGQDLQDIQDENVDAVLQRAILLIPFILSLLLNVGTDRINRMYRMNRSWSLHREKGLEGAHMEHSDLTKKIIGCAMKVHGTLGPGFLESVYQNSLAHELRKTDLQVECDRRMRVTYDGVIVGDFCADMVVQGLVLVENKAVRTLMRAHEVQLVNYLTATGIDIGLLLNFGSRRLEYRRKARTFCESSC